MNAGFGRRDAGASEGEATPASRAVQQPAAPDPQPEAVDDLYADLRNKPVPKQTQEDSAAAPAPKTFRSQLASAKPVRSLAIAYLFWFILGQLSIHRFYLGATQSAIFQVTLFFGSVVTMFIFPPMGLAGLAGWGLWLFADLFLMPGLHREHCAQPVRSTAAFA